MFCLTWGDARGRRQVAEPADLQRRSCQPGTPRSASRTGAGSQEGPSRSFRKEHTPGFQISGPRTVREQVSVVGSHQLWQPQEMNTGPFGQGIPSPLALTRPTSRLDLCPATASSHGLSPRPAGSTGQWHVLSCNAQNLAASCRRWSECAERHTCLPRLISGGKSTGNNTELE